MSNSALIVIDIQNDTPKNYKEIINNINKAIDWAISSNIYVVYIRHENLSSGTKNFKPNTYGAELANELKVMTTNVFTKYKGNALNSEDFINFIKENNIKTFYLTGADATICVKSTCFNLCKENYDVKVLSDCISSWNKIKIPEMLDYYKSKGAEVISTKDLK